MSRLYHFEALNIDTPAGVFNPAVKSTVYKLYYFIVSVKWIQSHGRIYFVNSAEQRKNVGSPVGIKLLVLNKEERC